MTEEPQSTAWFLVQFKPNSQRIAERNLHRQGFRTFLPLHDVTLRARGHFTDTARPLFPGYLFLELDPALGGWRAVNSTLGVSRIVSFGGAPTEVPRGLVEELIARCDSNGKLMVATEVKAGDDVQVATGPFADFVAQVLEIDAQRRVWVLLELMGRSTRVAVDGANLRPIGPH